MARQGAQWDDWKQGKKHAEKVAMKQERILMLKTLHDEWEKDPRCDYDYLLRLRAKIRNAQNQLEAMAV
jgi:hypothetical protein